MTWKRVRQKKGAPCASDGAPAAHEAHAGGEYQADGRIDRKRQGRLHQCHTERQKGGWLMLPAFSFSLVLDNPARKRVE